MKNKTKIWMDFAVENLKSSEILLQSSLHLFTHKIPLGSALPDFVPDQKICEEILGIATQVYQDIKNQLSI